MESTLDQSQQKNALNWLWITAIIIVLDQITKWLAASRLDLYESVEVFPWLYWTLLHNYGAAFSFLNMPGGAQRWFFLVLTVIISIVLLVWLKRIPRTDRATAIPLALILGGAIGNLIDRSYHGYVIDFIDVPITSTWHWPAFNIADSAICVGAVLMIVLSFRKPPEDDAAQTHNTQP